MSKKSKREFHFSLAVLFRWLIFALLIFFAINYLSGNKSGLKSNFQFDNSDVLGINTQPLINTVNSQFEIYKKQATDFIDTQFKDIKKQVVNKIYESVINSINQ